MGSEKERVSMAAATAASMASSIPVEQQSPLEKQSLRRRDTSLAFIQSRLRRLSSISTETRDPTAPDAKGPLGLTLLHEPSEPRIDIIFVHGLFGGSTKTWSHNPDDPGTFWPKEWLPNETGFKHVRLHTYGYNSGGSRKQSSLGVHDFGQALIADLYNSPHLRKNDETPIVFVAHSMGGLVVKKAYLIANLDPTYKALAQRIKTLFFLGTPHRGADAAQTLRMARYLAGYAPKAYIDDLVPGSATLNQINEEFRHVCNNLRLWSFFEGVPTSFGATSALVVEKESPILGLPGEQIQYMEANHRSICKFETPICPNYLILQRSLVTAIEQLEADRSVQHRDQYKQEMERVSAFLQVEQSPEDLLLAINEKQHQGSCQWLTEDETFQRWVAALDDLDTGRLLRIKNDASRDKTAILWLTGRPGTGKSVASAHVATYLKSCNLDCSFYFFRHNDQSGSTVSALLRSLAFQMAESSYEIRRAILTLIDDGTRVAHGDHHILWSRLFVDRIFQLESLRPQFWVIDAVDECPSNTISALVPLLSKLNHTLPLRVFLTSRPGGQLERLLAQEKVLFNELSTGQAGSLRDIETFLLARCPKIRDADFDQDLLSDVLSKSNGIFLWASLTVARLDEAYSVEDMLEVLQTVPSEMDGFYSRIANSILASPNRQLAACILRWVVCSPRILTTAELAEAVKLDVGRTLTASPRQLETITGHLVFVDSQSRVHIAHETTSSFLAGQQGGLGIDLATAHCRLAEICLEILCGSDFTPPRRRRPPGSTVKTTRSLLGAYAASNLGHHLTHSPPSENLLGRIAKFLRSNILTWIERLAESGNLSVLQQSSRRLKEYATRGGDQLAGSTQEIHESITAWVKDIHHLVAAFHPGLLASPSSVHFIIPYFCPPPSMIRQQFVRPNNRLKISGPVDQDWSDILTSYRYQHETTTVACCEHLLAVGLINGDIMLYDTAGFGTFASVRTLTHEKRIEQLVFDPRSTRLICYGDRRLRCWDVRRHRTPSFPCLWTKDLDFSAERVEIDGERDLALLLDQKVSCSTSFRLDDGARGEPLLLDSEPSSCEHIRICPKRNLAALSYRNGTVVIWDIESEAQIGTFVRDGWDRAFSPPADDMLFNPNEELELLAISYGDWRVALCNPWTLEQIATQQIPQLIEGLTSTLDGRILGGVTFDGMTLLFLFESLQPIYMIQPPQTHFHYPGLAFSPDGLRIFKLHSQSCNVWEPLVLAAAQGGADDQDDALGRPRMEPIAPQKLKPTAGAFQELVQILMIRTAMEGVCLAGRSDGVVEVCDEKTGDVIRQLPVDGCFETQGWTKIKYMDWDNASNSMLVVDSTNRCVITQLSFDPRAKEVAFQKRWASRDRDIVRQAMLSPGATSLLLRNDSSLKLVNVARRSATRVKLPACCCTTHPTDTSCFIAILAKPRRLYLLNWAPLKLLSAAGGVKLIGDELPQGLSTRPGTWCWSRSGTPYMAQCVASLEDETPYFAAFDASKLKPDSTELDLQVWLVPSHLNLRVRAVVGIRKAALYFLDTTGWVCSVDLGNLRRLAYYTRHFFIPPTWQTGNQKTVITMVSDTAVALSRGGRFVVMDGFLEFEEKVQVGEGKGDVVVHRG